jgi:hypothetical protein
MKTIRTPTGDGEEEIELGRRENVDRWHAKPLNTAFDRLGKR